MGNLSPAPKNKALRKNLEKISIALLESPLTEQKEFEDLILFGNCIYLEI